MTFIFRRWVSSIPPKAHLHKILPDNSFPIGYKLTGIHAGVKKKDILDLAVVLSTSPHPTSAAACFTRNAFKAAPVLVSDQVLTANAGRVRALVINSGCANAVTGKQGLQDAQAMVKYTSSLLPSSDENVPEIDALVMSTGVIGQTLPISNIIAGIRRAADSLGSDFAAWERAAKALMTTDTFPKLRSRIFTINNVQYRLAGMDKGAGMIHPDMGPASTSFSSPQQLHATLLGCIMTDAAVSPRSLQNALTHAVDRSFNSISVDGDMSTNDTIVIFANGAAAPIANGRIHEIDEEIDRDSFEIFKKELTDFAADLAQLVVRDGEGATKFVAVNVKGAPSYKDAHTIASKISTSALVKTALYGEDANWGRILAATGSVPLTSSLVPTPPLNIDPTKVSVTFVPSDGTASLPVLSNGEPESVDENRAKQILTLDDINIVVDLGMGGDGEATYWTCDLSYEYVKINGDYRS